MANILHAARITGYNIKILRSLTIAAALLLVAVTPVFFTLSHTTFQEMARVGELFLSVIGILLLPSLSGIEERESIQEIAYIRRTPHVLIFLLRLLLLMLLTFITILSVTLYARLQHGNFDLWKMTAGVWVTATFLGLLGLTVTTLSNDLKSGYLIAFGYYIFEFFTKGLYTSGFYTFSLLTGSFTEKYRLLALIGAAIAANSLIVWRKS